MSARAELVKKLTAAVDKARPVAADTIAVLAGAASVAATKLAELADKVDGGDDGRR